MGSRIYSEDHKKLRIDIFLRTEKISNNLTCIYVKIRPNNYESRGLEDDEKAGKVVETSNVLQFHESAIGK